MAVEVYKSISYCLSSSYLDYLQSIKTVYPSISDSAVERFVTLTNKTIKHEDCECAHEINSDCADVALQV